MSQVNAFGVEELRHRLEYPGLAPDVRSNHRDRLGRVAEVQAGKVIAYTQRVLHNLQTKGLMALARLASS